MVWCEWVEGEMRGEVWGLRSQQWVQDHWGFDLQEVMDRCSSNFRTAHYHCPFKLHHPTHQESPRRCLRRRIDCSTGSANSPLERRLGCCSCVLFRLQFSAGCYMSAKVWIPIVCLVFHFSFSLQWSMLKRNNV